MCETERHYRHSLGVNQSRGWSYSWNHDEYFDDIEAKNIFELFPEVQFYDYTKISNRKTKNIKNYHLTWSYSGANADYAAKLNDALDNGMNAAVVFRKQYKLPQWRGINVTDGDKDDLRFLDPCNSIVALYAKGAARHDKTGFVVDA